jgi:hypothetical protein
MIAPTFALEELNSKVFSFCDYWRLAIVNILQPTR